MENGVINMTVAFSGRFDPPHPGHIVTVLRLLKQFNKVHVIILDYPERDYPIGYVMRVFRECFEGHNVELIVNETHFGRITMEEWQQFKCDWYASGNLEVLRHIERLGILVYYIERAFDYSASKYERLVAP